MTQIEDADREMRVDLDSFAGGYFRNAVYRHWDPYDDNPETYVEAEIERLPSVGTTGVEFEEFRTLLPLVLGTVPGTTGAGVDPEPVVEDARERLSRRIEILTNAEAGHPPSRGPSTPRVPRTSG